MDEIVNKALCDILVAFYMGKIKKYLAINTWDESKCYRDEKGRFAKKGLIFFKKWDNAPTIKLIKSQWNNIKDIETLRTKVKDYLKNTLRKTALYRKELGNIRFSRKSIDEYISYSSDRDKLLAAKQIPEFITRGKLGDFEKSNKDRSLKQNSDSIVGFYPIYFNLNTENGIKKAEILIAKDNAGNLFFDMFLDYDRIKAQEKKGFKLEPKSSCP